MSTAEKAAEKKRLADLAKANNPASTTAASGNGEITLRETKEGCFTPVKCGNKIVLLNHGKSAITDKRVVKKYGEIPVTTQDDLALVWKFHKSMRSLFVNPNAEA